MRRVFSQRTAAELRAFLRAVVLHGTGDPTAQIPGYATAGKTGTAEMVVDGAVPCRATMRRRSSAWFRYPHARYVIYVKVERPIGEYYGSEVAAPAFAEIARAAMLHAGVLPSAPRCSQWAVAQRRADDAARPTARRRDLAAIAGVDVTRNRDRFAPT